MGKLGVSLCILAHNRIAETANLISSLQGFKDVELEVCIADQESDEKSRTFFFQTADKFTEVSDHELWHKGFGYAKHQAVALASNNWVAVGDPGEVWHEIKIGGKCRGLAEAINQYNGAPAFRVYYGAPRQVQRIIDGHETLRSMHGELCRVFDKRKMRMAGYIHEAPVHAETGALWSGMARQYDAVAVIEHIDSILEVVPGQTRGKAGQKPEDPAYAERKRVLYDHLLHMIVTNPQLRHGTDFRWWTAHWNTVVAPRFTNISFEEWKAIGG